MGHSYTLIALRPSKLTLYHNDADFDQEELLVETGLTLTELEDRVAELGCEESRYGTYGNFIGYQEVDSEVQSCIAQVLAERVAPVLKQRKEAKKAQWDAECKARSEENRAKALAEFERLRKELGMP